MGVEIGAGTAYLLSALAAGGGAAAAAIGQGSDQEIQSFNRGAIEGDFERNMEHRQDNLDRASSRRAEPYSFAGLKRPATVRMAGAPIAVGTSQGSGGGVLDPRTIHGAGQKAPPPFAPPGGENDEITPPGSPIPGTGPGYPVHPFLPVPVKPPTPEPQPDPPRPAEPPPLGPSEEPPTAHQPRLLNGGSPTQPPTRVPISQGPQRVPISASVDGRQQVASLGDFSPAGAGIRDFSSTLDQALAQLAQFGITPTAAGRL